MRNKIILFIVAGILSIGIANAQRFPENLIDANEKSLSIDSLKRERVFFLITSLKSGHCWDDIAFYNQISTDFSEKCTFIALFEDKKNYAKSVINDYKGKDHFYNKTWILIPQSMPHIRKMWKTEAFPEFHVFENGEPVKSFIYSNKKTKRKILDYLNSLD